MIFSEAELAGAYLVDLEPMRDERGFFSRSWCSKEFDDQGLNADLVQCNLSYNKHMGTLRGMHFQLAPHEEVKLVRCVRGSMFDVIVDLRPDSPTYCRWQGVELNSENRSALYIPGGLAHGFLTLTDETEVFYQMSSWFEPTSSAGIRWNDPAIDIHWPNQPTCISQKDQDYPDFVT